VANSQKQKRRSPREDPRASHTDDRSFVRRDMRRRSEYARTGPPARFGVSLQRNPLLAKKEDKDEESQTAQRCERKQTPSNHLPKRRMRVMAIVVHSML